MCVEAFDEVSTSLDDDPLGLRVPLGSGRDQVHTKVRPEFLELRSHVMAKIRHSRGAVTGPS
jgi:hypothetical protein